MTENNSLKKGKILCPNCNFEFIPESFHLESTIFDFKETSSGVHIETLRNVLNNIEIRPKNVIKKAWITLCPKCNYLLKFAAEVLKKELIEDYELNKVKGAFNELGKYYQYKVCFYQKPVMDYEGYIKEIINILESKIERTLNNIRIDEWSSLCLDYLNRDDFDFFKFIIFFYTEIENYCNSKIISSKNSEMKMKEKIKNLNMPQSIESKIQYFRMLRNKIVHEKYELTQKDANETIDAFISFLYYILLEELNKLNITREIEEYEYDFIDKESVKFEIKRFLHIFLGEKLKFKGSHGKILLPIVKDLNLEKSN